MIQMTQTKILLNHITLLRNPLVALFLQKGNLGRRGIPAHDAVLDMVQRKKGTIRFSKVAFIRINFPDGLLRGNLRQRGIAYAREHLTWDGKARVTTDILLWATGCGSKPELQPPERLSPTTL